MNAYNDVVLSQQPKHFYPRFDGQTWPDVVGDADGRFVNGHGERTMPDGSLAPWFDGVRQYAIMPDRSALGPAGALTAWTVTFWVRPSTTRYPNSRGYGYVHFVGKRDEWLGRIYRSDATDDDGEPYRQNWLSMYVFDPDERFGAGQSYQDGVEALRWYHVAFVVRIKERTCGLFLDGVRIGGWPSLEDDEGRIRFDVHPVNTTSSLIVGRDSALNSAGKPRSWFRGAVGKPGFFTYDLSAYDVTEQHPAGRITQQALAGRPLG